MTPILSDQVLLGSPHMEGVMVDIKFTYFKIKMLHGIFDLAELYKIYSITQYKCKLNFAKYNKNCNMLFSHNTNMIPVTAFCNMLTATTLGVPSHHKVETWVETGSNLFLSSKLFC